MANIVKDSSNRVYQNPAKLLLLIPIGVIIFVYLFDIIYLKYNEIKLNKITIDLIEDVLDHEEFSSNDAFEDYLNRKFDDLGYDEGGELSIVFRDKYIIVTTHYEFFSLRGYLFNKNAYVSSVYLGYFDEYKKPVAIKYENNQEIPDSNYYIFENRDLIIE